jgi:hypothetical protein
LTIIDCGFRVEGAASLLTPGTFIMALVYTFLYLRGQNLLVFGIFHGWMGAFIFTAFISGIHLWKD